MAKGPTIKLGPIEIDVPSFGGLLTGTKQAKTPLEIEIRELGKLFR
jgi:hypothetical protein